MKFRIEKDSLGKRKIPDNLYYGIQTTRALDNFKVSGITSPHLFVKSYVILKKSAALSNIELKQLDKKIGKAIVKACDDVLNNKFLDQFVIDVFQAGAGTSFNMNVNEVLANRALEILKYPKGRYEVISPNDHVNKAQSTNDTYPTAMHIFILFMLRRLIPIVYNLTNALNKKGREFIKVRKAGRTHLMDAVPIKLGEEFFAYGKLVKRAGDMIKKAGFLIKDIPIGGTAVGNGVNAHPRFRKIIVKHLNKITRLGLRAMNDPREYLQSCFDISTLSSAVKNLALELIRIANDLRLLASGPTTGLSEINLPPVQPGSSIMPGKVNPVMVECLNMIAFQIIGNDLTISMAVQAGQLELNVMRPVMMYNIFTSIDMLNNFIPIFIERCLSGITVNKEKCERYFRSTPSAITSLTPVIGYMKAAEIYKEAVKTGVPVLDIAKKFGVDLRI